MPEPAGQPSTADVRIRVALISSGLGFVARGVETWMTEVAIHLPPSIEAELWSGGEPPAIPGRTTRTLKAISRDSAVQRAFSWHRRYINEQLSCLPRAILLLRRHRPDIAYCGDPVLAWHLKRFQKTHGARVVFMNGMRLSPNWAKAFDGVQLIAPAYLEEAKRELGEANVNQFFVVPHFVDTNQFTPANEAENAAARKQLDLPADTFVVLNVGPVGTVSGKRLEWIAKELSLASGSAVLLSVGGDEDGAAAVHALAKAALGGRFQPVGSQPRERMRLFYQAADAYALAALTEPFSIAILEALACGLPVVHHEFEVTSWITGPAGLPVSMTEAGAAADKLRLLESDIALRQTHARASRDEVVKRFSAPFICERLASEFVSVAGRSPIQTSA